MGTIIFYIYVFLVPLEIYIEKIPKGPAGLNYTNLTLILLVGWWLLGRLGRGKPPVLRTPLNLPLILMLAWFYFGLVLTNLTIPGTPSAFEPFGEPCRRFLQFYNAVLLFFVAANMLDTRRKILWMLLVLCLVSIPAVRAFRSDLMSVLSWHYSDTMRVKGPFVWIGSNELGAFFVFSALFLGVFGIGARGWFAKCFFFGAFSLYFYGILYSFSRGTQLAFLISAAVVALIRYRLALALILLLAISSPVWLPVSVRERWEKTTDENGQLEASAQSRKDFASTAWVLFQQSPIIGNGVGSFKVLNPAKMDTHNLYMRTLTESGVAGFAILMTVWAMVLKVGIRLWRGGRQEFDRNFGFCLFIATLGLMITNLFGDRFTYLPLIGQFWVLAGMAARMAADMDKVEVMADSAEDSSAETEEDKESVADAGEIGGVELPGRLALQPRLAGLSALLPSRLARAFSAPKVTNLAPFNPKVKWVNSENKLPDGEAPKLNLVAGSMLAPEMTLPKAPAAAGGSGIKSSGTAKIGGLNIVGSSRDAEKKAERK